MKQHTAKNTAPSSVNFSLIRTGAATRLFNLARQTTLLLTVLLLLPLPLGCASRDAETSIGDQQQSSTGKVRPCEQACAKLELCDSDATDETDCVEACVEDQAASAEFQRIIAACFEESACNEIANGTAIDCVDDKISDLALSRAAKDYCREFAEKADSCNDALDEATVVDLCDEIARTRGDEFLSELSTCLDKSCNDVSQCSAGIADDFNTIWQLRQVISGPAPSCCTTADECGWANDGQCDCERAFAWDSNDCGGYQAPGASSSFGAFADAGL